MQGVVSRSIIRSMTVERWQRIAVWVAGVSVLLGLGASTGCVVVPKGPPSFAWLLHPLVMLLGALGGYATMLRKREIDERRWEIVQDDQLTSGERQYAHREAEREIRIAGTVFLLAAVGFGYWMAYQFNVEEAVTVADFLIVTPLFGFLAGLLFGLSRTAPRSEGSGAADPSPSLGGSVESEYDDRGGEDPVVEVPITDVLDLHSFQPKDVADVVRDYLDAASERGLRELRIIHGRGVGVQRQIVRRILERDERVASYGDAPAEAGGWGATLVRLRD